MTLALVIKQINMRSGVYPTILHARDERVMSQFKPGPIVFCMGTFYFNVKEGR